MIRFTKDGKVDRTYWIDPQRLRIPEGNALEENRRTRDAMKLADDLADALDVAVAALRWYADPVAYSMPVQNMEHHVFPDKGKTASDALVKMGADHAD